MGRNIEFFHRNFSAIVISDKNLLYTFKFASWSTFFSLFLSLSEARIWWLLSIRYRVYHDATAKNQRDHSRASTYGSGMIAFDMCLVDSASRCHSHSIHISAAHSRYSPRRYPTHCSSCKLQDELSGRCKGMKRSGPNAPSASLCYANVVQQNNK